MNYNSNDFNELISDSYQNLASVVRKTNTRVLGWMNRLANKNIIAKCENHQMTGNFKFRGAYNRLLKQPKDRKIIVASAGNHALAIAEAALKLKISTTICIPTIASQTKRDRLAQYGHALIIEGTSLEETTQYAKGLALDNDWDFISPYNDPYIISGQATLVLEFLEQHPNLTHIVVPVGGGGLISGAAMAAKKINPKIKIIGVQSERYASLHESIKQGVITRVPDQPTMADGLAVNLEANSITFQIVKGLVDELVIVSEEDIAAAVFTILYRESLLVEPAGAVALAAIMAEKIKVDDMQVGVIFSGGNISVKTLSKIISFPFKNPELFKYFDYRGEDVTKKQITYGIDKRIKIQANLNNSSEMIEDAEEDICQFSRYFHAIHETLIQIKTRLEDYKMYCKNENIMEDSTSINMLNKLEQFILDEISSIDLNLLRQCKGHRYATQYNKLINIIRQKYRMVLQLVSFMQTAPDWRAAAYEQSTVPMFFKIESLSNTGVNYNRYESSRVVSIERQIADVLNIDQKDWQILITSSGMASFTIIENYLSAYKLSVGDTILVPYYIYFEAEEQLRKFSNLGIKVIRSEEYDLNNIVELVKKHLPRVIFIDPLTNTVDMRLIDLIKLINLIEKTGIKNITYIVDGSMISASLPIQQILDSVCLSNEVLYYESASKYLQLGIDISMAGITVIPRKKYGIFERIRRNTGGILYDALANSFPKYNRADYMKRMARMQRNAMFIAYELNRDPRIYQHLAIIYPALLTHPDYENSLALSSCGGIITFKFYNDKLNQYASIDSCIQYSLDFARSNSIALTKGTGFGFSIPRFAVASPTAETCPPFLRLSVGDASLEETKLLAKSVQAGLLRFLQLENVKITNISPSHSRFFSTALEQSKRQYTHPYALKSVLGDIIPHSPYFRFISPDLIQCNYPNLNKIIAKAILSGSKNNHPITCANQETDNENILSGKQITCLWTVTDYDHHHKVYGSCSMFEASTLFGNRVAELGRFVLMQNRDALYGLLKFLKLWEAGRGAFAKYDMFVSIVENPTEIETDITEIPLTPVFQNVSSMLLTYVAAKIWGIIPWYLTSDIEENSFGILNLIIKNRQNNTVINYFSNHTLYLYSHQHASILKKFVQFNIGCTPKFCYENNPSSNDIEASGWEILSNTDENPITLIPANNTCSFSNVLEKAKQKEGYLEVVYLPLTKEYLMNQKSLLARGYTLTGFTPGLVDNEFILPARGIWSQLRTFCPIINPTNKIYSTSLVPNWLYNFVTETIRSLNNNRFFTKTDMTLARYTEVSESANTHGMMRARL